MTAASETTVTPGREKCFAVLWMLYIGAFIIGPETRGRRLEELDAV